MKWNAIGWCSALVLASAFLLACESDEDGGRAGGYEGPAGDGDGDATSGDGDGDQSGDGDGDGDSLNQGALAANCSGVTAEDGSSCDEPGRVCPDDSGSTCVCGGFDVTSGDGDGDFGGNGRPWDDDDDDDDEPEGGSGQWECFSIGSPGSGGSENMGGADGSGGNDGSGGEDGTGGDSMGGQGGAPSN